MLITPKTLRAFTIAQEAHKGQVDKGGHPYIEHVMFVASHVSGEKATVVALLHDTLEDTELTAQDLAKAGISPQEIQTIILLTREPGTDYFNYIERLKSDPIAVKVKLADLRHNSDLSRLSQCSERDIQRSKKYQKAIEMLSQKPLAKQA